jgi:hypothetical protein
MRARLGFITVGIVVPLALMATGAQATGSRKIASACSNETVNVAHVGKLTIRFGLKGRVSCAEAHHVIGMYFREMSAGHCGSMNNFCDLALPGGWGCSIFPAAEEKEAGGAFAGCYEMTTGAKIRVYKASRPTSTPGMLHLREFNSPDRKVWCSVGTSTDVSGRSCGTNPEPPTRSAELDRDGEVRLCFVPELIYPSGGHVPEGCFQNWNYKAPVLKYGQATEENGVRCTSATNGITCIKVASAGKGKGFRINKDEAVEVG